MQLFFLALVFALCHLAVCSEAPPTRKTGTSCQGVLCDASGASLLQRTSLAQQQLTVNGGSLAFHAHLALNKTPLARETTPSVKAFEGAMGPGTDTPGGRFGKLLIVDTLEDGDGKDEDGKRTLRWAVEQEYPRFIVFKVGGIIKLSDDLRIEDDFVTIAGHSAPPPGITITGATVKLYASDSIFRFTRIRVGDKGCSRAKYMDDRKCTCNDKDALITGEWVTRVVIDHISAAWGTDENLCPNRVYEATVSYSLIGQALHNSCHEEENGVQRHGYGSLAKYYEDGTRMLWHHNLWAGSSSRTPRLGNNYEKDVIISLANNVIHEGNFYGGDSGTQKVNVVNNVKVFPKTKLEYGKEESQDTDETTMYKSADTSRDKFYVSGNMALQGTSTWTDATVEDVTIQSSAFALGVGHAFHASSARDAYSDVLEHVGVYAIRDRVDSEVLHTVRESVEAHIDSPGGCCVEDSCAGTVKVGSVGASKCKLISCSTKFFKGSQQCSIGDAEGIEDAAIADLNSDIPHKDGIDWASSSYHCTSNCDFTLLEKYLETCLHPSEDGSCAGGSSGGGGAVEDMSASSTGWTAFQTSPPSLAPPSVPVPVPPPVPVLGQCPETGQTLCSTNGHCEYLADENKETCDTFCNRYGLQCEDEWDDVADTCEKHSNDDRGCNRKRSTHICRCRA